MPCRCSGLPISPGVRRTLSRTFCCGGQCPAVPSCRAEGFTFQGASNIVGRTSCCSAQRSAAPCLPSGVVHCLECALDSMDLGPSFGSRICPGVRPGSIEGRSSWVLRRGKTQGVAHLHCSDHHFLIQRVVPRNMFFYWEPPACARAQPVNPLD